LLKTGSTNISIVNESDTAEFLVEVYDSSYYGHHYVDLGLSIKWANCNIGGLSCLDFGDYFAWGETESAMVFGEDDNGRKGKLSNEEDAAQVYWGGNWRMTSKDEMEELCDTAKCVWEKVNVCGVDVCKVTSKIDGYRGTYIYLPLSGIYSRKDLEGGSVIDSHEGAYWSNEGISENGVWALRLYWNNHDNILSKRVYYMNPGYGISIRPVCPK